VLWRDRAAMHAVCVWYTKGIAPTVCDVRRGGDARLYHHKALWQSIESANSRNDKSTSSTVQNRATKKGWNSMA